MTDILQEIVVHKRMEVELLRQELSERELHAMVEQMMNDGGEIPSMSRALSKGNGIIAEFKRRSPSKGWIKKEGDVSVIPLGYQDNGASALSILTDTKFFGGADIDITTARKSGVTIPILYKNFVIDEYQLFKARLCGASAVLLIAACLSKKEYRQLLSLAHTLGLEVLLEMHSESELEYADTMPDLCGINNRNLGTFITDVNNSFRLAELLPKDAVKVSESGISNPDTVNALKDAGFNGFLIGESFMRNDNPAESLHDFINKLKQ